MRTLRGITEYMRTLSRAFWLFASVLPTVTFCICGGRNALSVALAIAVHECAHLLALRIFHGRIRTLGIAPFGFCIDYDSESLSLFGEMCVCFFGCAANLILAALSFILYRYFRIDLVTLGVVNLAFAALNFTPVCPLDGYFGLRIFLSLFLSPFLAWRVSVCISCTVGAMLFSVSSYMLLTSVTGIYPLLFSIYIFSVNCKNLCQSG